LGHLGLLRDDLYLFYGNDYDGDNDDEVVVVVLTKVEVYTYKYFFPRRFHPILGYGLPLWSFAITLIGHTTLGRITLDE